MHIVALPCTPYTHVQCRVRTCVRTNARTHPLTASGACVHKDTVCVHCVHVQMEPIVRDMQHASQGVRVRGKAHLGKSKSSSSPSFSGKSLHSEHAWDTGWCETACRYAEGVICAVQICLLLCGGGEYIIVVLCSQTVCM